MFEFVLCEMLGRKLWELYGDWMRLSSCSASMVLRRWGAYRNMATIMASTDLPVITYGHQHQSLPRICSQATEP